MLIDNPITSKAEAKEAHAIIERASVALLDLSAITYEQYIQICSRQYSRLAAWDARPRPWYKKLFDM